MVRVVVVVVLDSRPNPPPPSRAVLVERLIRASRDREVSGEVIVLVVTSQVDPGLTW